jgi:hypothetical protein
MTSAFPRRRAPEPERPDEECTCDLVRPSGSRFCHLHRVFIPAAQPAVAPEAPAAKRST